MLEHAGEVSVREKFEVKIAENSQTTLKMWEKWNLKLTKVGAIPSKQNYRIFSKTSGRTKASVK